MKPFILFLTSLLTATAADPSWTDWRQLWYPEQCKPWHAKSIPQLRAEAEAGNAVAMQYLFRRLYGKGNVNDTKEANQWVIKAAAAGLPQAILWVEIKNNSPEPAAVQHRLTILEKTAATGYPEAEAGLAALLVHGSPLKPDLPRALALARSAHDKGSLSGSFELANLYSRGIGEPRNPEETPAKLLQKAASLGSKSAIEALAIRHHFGIGVEKDGLLEASYYARIKVHLASAYALDQLFKNSPPDQRALLELFTRALLHRSHDDFIKLAEMHEKGMHGKNNPIRAAALYTLGGSTAKADAIKQTLEPNQAQRIKDDIAWLSPEF